MRGFACFLGTLFLASLPVSAAHAGDLRTLNANRRGGNGESQATGSGKAIQPRPGTLDRLEAQGDSKEGRFSLTFKGLQ